MTRGVSMYELLVGGCSGSNTPAHSRPNFGHLTTSFGLLDRKNKRGIIIDNGTGVQLVAKEMLKSDVVETTIFQTHFHSDHLEGLQLNGLLFGKTVQEIVVPRFKGMKEFKQILEERFDPTAWPVSPKTFGFTHPIMTFTAKEPFLSRIRGNVFVKTLPLNHPGGCVGYRFETPDETIVIATDNELGYYYDSFSELRRLYGLFVSGADVLIADVQYTDDEYKGKVELGGLTSSRTGWGHSTPVMLAETLRHHCPKSPKEIYLTHHDPSRTDDELFDFADKAKEINTRFCPLMPSL